MEIFVSTLYTVAKFRGQAPPKGHDLHLSWLTGKTRFLLLVCFVFLRLFFSAILDPLTSLSLKLLIKCDYARHLKGKFQKCTNKKCWKPLVHSVSQNQTSSYFWTGLSLLCVHSGKWKWSTIKPDSMHSKYGFKCAVDANYSPRMQCTEEMEELPTAAKH